MADLNELLRQVERNDAPDLWQTIERRQLDPAPVMVDGRRRWPVILLSSVIGIAGFALVWKAFGEDSASPLPSAFVVTSPAPRECPFGFVRGGTVSAEEFLRLSGDLGPTWLPDGFGLQQTWGRNDAFAATALWSDATCREVMMLVGSGDISGIDGPKVGPWTVGADAPSSCGNAVLGSGRCLDYFATAADSRTFTLQMMGVSRAEGDRIAQSIQIQSVAPTASTCQYGPWAQLCPEAAWVRHVLQQAGVTRLGDTGSAIVARRGGEFYMWTTYVEEERPLSQIVSDEGYVTSQSANGTAVYSDGVRFFWRVEGLYVWLQSGEEGFTINPDLIDTLVVSSERTPVP